MTTSFDNAAQLLLPREPGLPHLRSNRAGELTLDPGGLTATDDGRIASLEPTTDADVHVDATGCALLPGLVDCHTHLPFAGWRAREYEQKVTGWPMLAAARRSCSRASPVITGRSRRNWPAGSIHSGSSKSASVMCRFHSGACGLRS